MNNANFFTTNDKNHCDQLFQSYEDLQNITIQILKDANLLLFQYDQQTQNAPFKQQSDALANHIKQIAQIQKENTKALIKKIEDYLRQTHNLKFKSLLQTKNYQIPSILIDYNHIITNITKGL